MSQLTPLPPMDGAVLRTRSHGVGRDAVAVWESIWRRRWIPFSCLAVGIALGIAGMMLTPPAYKASAQIMIETKDAQNGVLQSEVAIAQSTPVLSKVAGKLSLFKDPSFIEPSLLDRVLLRASDENTVRDRVMARLAHMIDVRVLRDTSIIDMSVHDSNPDRAAQIANALLASYQERKVDERFEQSRQISAWMGKRLDDLKSATQDAKNKLENFQTENMQQLLNESTIQSERMTALNRDMAQAKGVIDSLSQRLTNASKNKDAAGHVASLKNAQNILQAELADLQSRYGDRHPKVIAKKAALAQVKRDLTSAALNDRDAIGRDLAESTQRMNELQAQIDALLADADINVHLKLEYKNLESDVAANERLYADFLIKYQDMIAQTELGGTDAKVISMATIPAHPDQSARLIRVLALGALGFLLGLLYVVLALAWATGFTTANQLESMTGYPVFAIVPWAGKGNSNQNAVHHNVMQNPAAVLAESLRSLRVSLRLRGETGRRPRVVALTSTLPDEGKTSLSVMLAMVAAKSGERVCVVDCDLRRPSLHKAFGIGNARGLADFLSDRLSIDDVIYRKDPSGVHLVTSKAVPSYSLTLLTSGRMERLIENLREQYDLVILDAPSSLAFADARVLARMVDQTLYVVAWNRTRRESVTTSLKAYADMGYADLALVLNKVDLGEYLRDSASSVVYQYGQELSTEAAPGY